jgi:23S rRNA pseudouridine1911/1915/1917 synthase
MAVVHLEVPVSGAGLRLDRFVAGSAAGLSRSGVQKLIAAGRVTVNGSAQRASYAVVPGDAVEVQMPDPPTVGDPAAPRVLSVLYEDAAIMVVDKPAGLVVHEAAGHRGETLVSTLVAHRPDLAVAGMDPQRPGIVHRLDRDTSGVVVVAMEPASLAALQRQFRRREVHKEYLALVHGSPEPSRAAIEAPIARDEANRARMALSPEGRYARSEYEVLERFRGVTLVSVNLMTGRTHQIRVHMAAIGHPVVGDRTYGSRRKAPGAARQMLHAQRLTLTHPQTLELMTFEAPVPADMQVLLESLRRAS